MREALVIAGHYFQRLARKPLLLLFLLAIPFTLLLAEFAAFGRTAPDTQIAPLPVILLQSAHSPAAERFARCLAEQPGHPLLLRETAGTPADTITISGAGKIDVALKTGSSTPADTLLESSILKICVYQAAQPAGALVPVTVERAAPSLTAAALARSSFFAGFFPGLALFGALFLGQAMASLVWRDHERAVQQRLLASPGPRYALIFGPFLFLAAGAGAALVLILTVGALIAAPAALASPVLWALALGFGLFVAGLQSAIGFLVRAPRAAQAVSASTNMMLAFFGGGFVPLSLYPPLLRALAYALPNGAAQAGITQTLLASGSPSSLLWRIFTVWAWAAVFVFAAVAFEARRLRAHS